MRICIVNRFVRTALPLTVIHATAGANSGVTRREVTWKRLFNSSTGVVTSRDALLCPLENVMYGP